MSEQILSQDEISALLGGGGGGGGGGGKKKKKKAASPGGGEGAASKAAAKAAAIQESVAAQVAGSSSGPSVAASRNVFPILKPQGLGTELENTLNVVLDSFAQNGVSTLAASLRAQVSLRAEGMDQLSYREFIQGLPEPSSIWSLHLKPVGLNVALCFETRLVHAIVDRLMGGEGTVPKVKRSISELDQSVVESMVKVYCREFEDAWRRIMAFEMTIESRETRPGFLQLYPHGEGMISIIMLMRVGSETEGVEGQVFWGIPASMLMKFKNKLENQSQGRSGQSAEQAHSRIKRIMQEMPTSLEARISGTRVLVSELLEMSAGDVIRIDHRIDSPVEVAVNGSSKFTGHVALSRGRKAVQLTTCPEPPQPIEEPQQESPQ